MRSFITTLVFAIMTTCVFGQNMGSVKVQNLGNTYRISVGTMPAYNFYPMPDSNSIRVTVICKATLNYEQVFLPATGHVDYSLGGINYIGITVFRWKKYNGVWYKLCQQSIPTVCIFGLNPIFCYQKQ